MLGVCISEFEEGHPKNAKYCGDLIRFMRTYSLHVIKTCHKRGAFAMGGMAAQIPIRGDDEANDAAFAKVRADKEREATDGHDGTWVAHPGLVGVAMDVFNEHMPSANQVDRQRDDVGIASAEDLTAPCEGPKSMDGLKTVSYTHLTLPTIRTV